MSKKQKNLTIAAALCFALGWLDWTAWRWLPTLGDGLLILIGAGAAITWVWRVIDRRDLTFWAVLSLALIPVLGADIFLTKLFGWHTLSAIIARTGTALLFVVGLLWAVWYVERRSREYASAPEPEGKQKIWNLLDPRAWFYRRANRKLDQSLATFLTYGLLFMLCGLILTRLGGCRELYEMPAGGGEEAQKKQVVKIKKIIEKKFVINPFSAVIFNPPPIEEVPVQLLEVTEHEYQIGQGAGPGAGFSEGTNRGKVRFIRLEYEGGDWDQDFGIGADLNLLLEYGIRTGQQVNDKTESRRVRDLKNFPPTKSPPVVYMTGQRNILFSENDVKILREYLTEKHGMLFADNGGSAHWHGQFFELMGRVLPTVRPVRIPLDHPVHQIPFEIPFLPYVAPHGGKDAMGWVIDGRLACYYHPGDIGDAWADGHAGVKRSIWESCYQLGTNIIFYGHAEYNKWVRTQVEE